MTMTTLADELPREMSRVRDDVLPQYLAVGATGLPAVTMMRLELERAAAVMVGGDVVGMIGSLRGLRSWSA